MKRMTVPALILLLFLIFNACHPFHASAKNLEPCLNKGKKWRIGYYEGGSWQDYRESLKALSEGLMDTGWIEKQPFPPVSTSDQPSTLPLWKWMASSIKSPYIEFVADAFWSSDWRSEKRDEQREACIRRLQNGSLDMILALGTWAGKDLANNRHSVPTLVMSTTDPIRSGIIKSAEDSGFDHVHARCDPTRHERQIRLFHDISHFKKIGVVYNENDPHGRVMSHIDKLEMVAKERGFTVVACSAPDSLVSLQESVTEFRACTEKLALQVDAFYLADMRGTEADWLWETIQPLIRHHVLTWSARGSKLVERGALFSVAKENYSFLSPYYASVVARIFHGQRPRDIPQLMKEKMRLAINLETARRMGYTVPPNLLKVADIVYDTVDDSVKHLPSAQ